MTSTSDDIARLQARFRSRRLVVLAGIGVLIVTFVVVKTKVVGSEWFFVALIGMAGVVGVAWRCPRCGGRFGLDLTVDSCPHCHLELRDRSPV